MRRPRLLTGLFALFVFSTFLLNMPSAFYEPLALWVRVCIPALLLSGFLGSVLRSRLLRVFGWAGVACFSLIVVVTGLPGEDYVLGGKADGVPKLPDGSFHVARVLILMVIAGLQVWCFRALGRSYEVDKAIPE